MRLIDVKKIANDSFEFSNVSSLFNTNGKFGLRNATHLRESIKNLIEIGAIEEHENPIIPIILNSGTDTIFFDASSYNSANSFLHMLEKQLTFFISWLDKFVPTEETETYINIKLPDVKDFKELDQTIKVINKGLNTIVSEIGGEIEIKQFDHGSYWIIIDAGIVEASSLILGLSSAAYVVANKSLKLLKGYEEYRALKLDNDFKKSIHKANRILIDELIEKEAQKVEQQHFLCKKEKSTDNERVARIKNSIKELSKLFKAGGEIHPSICAPKETLDNTINYKEISSDVAMKLIDSKNSDDEIENEQDEIEK